FVFSVSVWKDHRKLLNPTFNQQILHSFLDNFNVQSRQLIIDLEETVGNGPFDHRLYLEKNALRTICATALDADISNEYSDECLKSFQEILNIIIERFLNFHYFFDCFYNRSGLRKQEQQFIGNTHVFAESILQKKRTEIGNMSVEDGLTDAKFKPFIYQLLQQEHVTLTERQVKDEINVMILAGFETSATILLYTLILVGTYPHIQQKIFEEIEEVFGDIDRDVSKEDLAKLKYIEAVLKETTRYCPVGPITGRKLLSDVQLKNTVLKKGFNCMVMLYGAMRHPIWGPDADQYIPERWLDPDRLPKNPHAYMAFGYGKRNCIGKTYAIVSMKVVMVHIFRHYKVTGDFSKVQLKFMGLLKPHSGHHINIEYRNKQVTSYWFFIIFKPSSSVLC
ncbi:cytochrome P450 4V2-like, partial [Leptidea sinapis]|uniref:cytochrome P450 4V2-like n=1 Tax=Leptidea sinapis TaxID=189913 RepID=UPI0021C2A70C